MRSSSCHPLTMGICLWLAASATHAADWPMWRHDANRSAGSSEVLPAQLHLQWVRRLPRYEMAWPNEPRLHFDASHEPTAMGKMLYLGLATDGSVRALDTETGEERWRFGAGGEIRSSPAVADGVVYFGSNDGYLYALE